MKKSCKALTAFLLAASPMLVLADTSIGIANSNATDKFRAILQDSLSAYAKTKPGVSVSVEDAKDDGARQLAQVKELAAKKVGVIIIIPTNSTTAAMTDVARKASIPIVYVNNHPVEPLGDGTMYVGSDEVTAGRMQGDLLAKKLGGKGSVMILKGPSDHNGAVNRTKGLKAVLAGHPEMKVFGEEVGSWKRSEGRRIVAEMLKKGDLPSAIAANNDEMALGATDALAAAGGDASKILVVGVDATLDAMKAVKDGKMAATILQNAKGQGRAAIDLSIKMAAKEPVPKELMVPFELVVPENIDKYLALAK